MENETFDMENRTKKHHIDMIHSDLAPLNKTEEIISCIFGFIFFIFAIFCFITVFSGL